MLKTLVWVLGLGFVGLVLFGSTGGTILGGIGYVIGRHSSASSDAATSNPAARAAPIPSRYPWLIPGVIVLAVAGVVWAIWPPLGDGDFHKDPPTSRNDDILMEMPPLEVSEGARKPAGVGTVWSIDACLESQFGNAIGQGMPVPPEVRLYCAYPWDHKAFQSVLEVLHAEGVDMDAVFANLTKPGPGSEKSREVFQAIRELPMPEGLFQLYELYQVLPIVWSARAEKYKMNAAVLRAELKPEFIERLRKAAGRLPWERQVVVAMTRAVPMGEDDEVMLYSAGFNDIVLTNVPEIISGMRFARDALKQQAPSSGSKIVDEAMYRQASQGIFRSHQLPLATLDLHVRYLHQAAEQLRQSSSLPAEWKPAKIPQRGRNHPLEIYWMPAMPKGICGESRRFETGVYCADKDQIFVPSPAQKPDGVGITAQIFHEVAHAFLNPASADEFPFVAEGIATAYGERLYRASAAGVEAAGKRSTLQNQRYVGAVFGVQEDGTDAPGQSDSRSEALQYAKSQLEKFPPTSLSARALCHLRGKPPTFTAVQRYLSMSNGAFRKLPQDELALAYAYAWGIFYYGVDNAAIGLGTEGNQLDAGVIQNMAADIVLNKAPSDQQRLETTRFLSALQQRASKQISTWKIKC